jgi:hypothetical protein
LVQELQTYSNFRYQLVGFLLSVIYSGRPIEMDKPYIWLKPQKPAFYDLKSKVPLNLGIKYQRFNANGRPLDL